MAMISFLTIIIAGAAIMARICLVPLAEGEE
ncbi:hypothetical protein FHS03_002940 [Massilia violacea]|uniref:Uncharacterized protein n=1 Tax=Pseudoduganella violacea TaxID=1715466 RepID=A0A7W5FUF6_9BURK|nr:hypothetical protein [Pseudoduganella violacea]